MIYGQLTHPLEHGSIITAIQKLLREHHIGLILDGVYGPKTALGVKQFQAANHLKVDGIVGPATWAALNKDTKPVPVRPSNGWTPARVALFVLNHKGRGLTYTQGPLRMFGITHHIKLPKIPKWFDCSAFVTWCFYAAGWLDPNGPRFRYNGYGYSQTLYANGHPVSRDETKANDLVFYGHNGKTEHVVMAISSNHGVSMGMQGGPYLINMFTYRNDYMGSRRYAER
jgi:hypothetical protein